MKRSRPCCCRPVPACRAGAGTTLRARRRGPRRRRRDSPATPPSSRRHAPRPPSRDFSAPGFAVLAVGNAPCVHRQAPFPFRPLDLVRCEPRRTPQQLVQVGVSPRHVDAVADDGDTFGTQSRDLRAAGGAAPWKDAAVGRHDAKPGKPQLVRGGAECLADETGTTGLAREASPPVRSSPPAEGNRGHRRRSFPSHSAPSCLHATPAAGNETSLLL